MKIAKDVRVGALLLMLLLASWSLAEEEQVRLKVRSVPSDVTVWQGDRPLPRNPKDGTFSVLRPAEAALQVELRSPGHQPRNLQIRLGPEQSLIDIPPEKDQIIYLHPMSKDLQFQTQPRSMVYLQTGRDKHFLGQSDRKVAVPLSAGSSGRLKFAFQAPGYRTLTIELEGGQLAGDLYPPDGPLRLEPLLPLLSPVILWLSSRRFLSVTLLAIFAIAALVLLRKVVQSRAPSS